MAETYAAWLNLEERILRAQAELAAVMTARKKASSLLEQAQADFAQGESIQLQAQGIREVAWGAIQRLQSANPGAFAASAAAFHEIHDTKRTEARLKQAAQSQAKQEAEAARLKATRGVLEALDAVSVATEWVEQELEEAETLAAEAEALKGLAQVELASAQAVLNEVYQDGPGESELPDERATAGHADQPEVRGDRSPAVDSRDLAEEEGPGPRERSHGPATIRQDPHVPLAEPSDSESGNVSEEALKRDFADIRRYLETFRSSIGVPRPSPSDGRSGEEDPEGDDGL